jgi:hypothetical protein
MINRLIGLPLAILAAMVFASSAHAQARGGFSSASAGRTGMVPSGRHAGRPIARLRRSRHSSTGSGYVPYFYDDYDSEPEASEPPPQTVEATIAQPAPAAAVSKPGFVLELQGDHWVRLTNYGELQAGEQSGQPALKPASGSAAPVPAANPHRAQAAEPSSQLPPAVLVFRDGHEEEIRKYTIVGTTLYTSSDYWNSGSWTRKIQIADLDVPETLKLNQQRGAKFTLPSGPNEVMMRP